MVLTVFQRGRKIKYSLVSLVSVLVLAGCAVDPSLMERRVYNGPRDTVGHKSSYEIEHEKQEALSRKSLDLLGLPNVAKFEEKKNMKEIFELRDQEVATVTYFLDENGRMHKLCDSVGFGIPYSTQYTNPQYESPVSHNGNLLQQPDPNGLFSPPESEATWIMCINPQTGKRAPVYSEPKLIIKLAS
jgi:hypothetical protein